MDYEILGKNRRKKPDSISIVPSGSSNLRQLEKDERILEMYDKDAIDIINGDKAGIERDSKYKGTILTYEDINKKMKYIYSLFKKKEAEKSREQDKNGIINPLVEEEPLLIGDSEKIIRLTMQFYSGFDKDIYKKIMRLLADGKLFIYNRFDKSKEKQIKNRELPSGPFHNEYKGIYYPMLFNMPKDLYNKCPEIVGLKNDHLNTMAALVHELGHSLDVPDDALVKIKAKGDGVLEMDAINGQLARKCYLRETTPTLFEYLFWDFLLKKEPDYESIKKANSRYELLSAKRCVARTGYASGLAKVYQNNENDYDKRLEEYREELSMFYYKNGDNTTIVNDVCARKTIFHDLPYVLAQLIVPTFMKTYREDNKKGKEMVLEYLDRVKQDDFDGALEALGVDLKDDKNFKKLCDNLYEYMGEQEIKPIKEKKTPELEDI